MLSPNVGLEPTTLRLRVSCSTDWASRADACVGPHTLVWFLNFSTWLDTCIELQFISTAVVAEWLRRLTRNQFPSGSAGSNPADCDKTFSLPHLWHFTQFFPLPHSWHSYLLSSLPHLWHPCISINLLKMSKKCLETGGIDPPTSHMLSERSTIWATSPVYTLPGPD